MAKEKKTNVLKILDKKNVNYNHYTLDQDPSMSGVDVAKAIGKSPENFFKTLVTVSNTGKNYVFVIPVSLELDLKKCASVTSEKKIMMEKSKSLLDLTGYVHGGCSPIGMKKNFDKYFDKRAKNFDSIIFSAGKLGHQVEVKVKDLEKILDYKYEDLVQD